MILYLEGTETVFLDSGMPPLHPRINVQEYNDLERQEIYLAAKDYYEGLNIKWFWHMCYHIEKKKCLSKSNI